jgi:hypothetical protein
MKINLLFLLLILSLKSNAQFGYYFERSGNVLFRDWSASNFFNQEIRSQNSFSLLLNNPYFIPAAWQAKLEYGKRLEKQSANIGLGYGIFSEGNFRSNVLKLSVSKDINDFTIGGLKFINWLDSDFLESFPFLDGGLNFWSNYSWQKTQAILMFQYVYYLSKPLEPLQMRLGIQHDLSETVTLYCDLNHFLQRGFYAKFAVDLKLNEKITIGSGFTLNGREVFFSFIYNSGKKLKLRSNGSFSSPLGFDIWSDAIIKIKDQ